MSAIQERAERLMTERRTMQFVIEPREWMPERWLNRLPIAVWVEIPAYPRGNYAHSCKCQEVFRVVDESANEVVSTGFQWKQPPNCSPDNYPAVCACFGALCE